VAGEREAVYRLIVDQPHLLTLSGEGVIALNPSEGIYQITVAPGTNTKPITANATAGDGNNIVDAVRISIEGVIYGEDGILSDERVLQVVNLNVDDSYYDPNGAQLQVGTVNRDLLPIERPTSLTYIHALGGTTPLATMGR
jgi:hypothetical protein